MSSLQQSPPAQRRQPRSGANTPPAALSHSTHSEDSETVLLDNPAVDTQGHIQQQEEAPRILAPEDDPSIKKCWICFSDETEDTPDTSPWRDPCPCALVAHEQCLLDWIADAELPKNSSRVGALTGPEIKCPQCKIEIRLARPRDYAVIAVRTLERLALRTLAPVALVTLSGNVVYTLSFTHGIYSILRVFGPVDGSRILAPLAERQLPLAMLDLTHVDDIKRHVLAHFAHHAKHWRLYFGVPLIAPMLLLSRTTWSASEAFLTILPTVFFATQPSSDRDTFELGIWPPSASMAFALLPYARQAYNLYFERVWGARVRAWKQTVLPVVAQQTEGEQDPAQRIERAVEEPDAIEIQVDAGIWEDWEEPVRRDAQAAAGAPDVENAEQDAARPPANVPDEPAQPADAVARPRRGPGLTFSPGSIALNVLGALAFPAIAEISGEILRVVLPSSWTSTPPISTTLLASLGITAVAKRPIPTGVLQEKWGRSLIGGCLFVVLKDALMLYVRWKMAKMHLDRRVLDYDRSKARPKP